MTSDRKVTKEPIWNMIMGTHLEQLEEIIDNDHFLYRTVPIYQAPDEGYHLVHGEGLWHPLATKEADVMNVTIYDYWECQGNCAYLKISLQDFKNVGLKYNSSLWNEESLENPPPGVIFIDKNVTGDSDDPNYFLIFVPKEGIYAEVVHISNILTIFVPNDVDRETKQKVEEHVLHYPDIYDLYLGNFDPSVVAPYRNSSGCIITNVLFLTDPSLNKNDQEDEWNIKIEIYISIHSFLKDKFNHNFGSFENPVTPFSTMLSENNRRKLSVFPEMSEQTIPEEIKDCGVSEAMKGWEWRTMSLVSSGSLKRHTLATIKNLNELFDRQSWYTRNFSAEDKRSINIAAIFHAVGSRRTNYSMISFNIVKQFNKTLLNCQNDVDWPLVCVLIVLQDDFNKLLNRNIYNSIRIREKYSLKTNKLPESYMDPIRIVDHAIELMNYFKISNMDEDPQRFYDIMRMASALTISVEYDFENMYDMYDGNERFKISRMEKWGFNFKDEEPFWLDKQTLENGFDGEVDSLASIALQEILDVINSR